MWVYEKHAGHKAVQIRGITRIGKRKSIHEFAGNTQGKNSKDYNYWILVLSSIDFFFLHFLIQQVPKPVIKMLFE